MNSIKNFTLILLIGTLLASCAGLKSNPKKINRQKGPTLSDFDKKILPNDEKLIARMIEIVQPELSDKEKFEYARAISKATHEHKVNPQIIIALIDTESDFSYTKVSNTGDLSVAQVNVEVWNKEFKRMKAPLIDIPRLVANDQTYAISTMARILAILKKRHAKVDRRWYARYHSNTKKYKWNYLRKIEIRMKMLERDRETQVLAIN